MLQRLQARAFRSGLAAACILAVAGLLPAPAAAQADPTLAASFGLNEASGTSSADLSGNGHTATLVNGPAWVAGRYGNALSFDGVDDSVAVANGSSLNLGSSNFTLMMWIKRNALGGGIQRHLFSKCSAAVRQTGCKEFLFNGNTLRFSSFATGNTNAGTISDTNWHHVAAVFTRSNNRLQIYVDGTLRTTATRNLEADNAAHVVAVGSVIGANSFSGLIDEVRFYSRALTAAQVTTDMNTPLAPVVDTTPPVLSNAAPTGVLAAGTTQTTLSVTSNENATCRYSTTAGTAYSAMTTTFTGTGGTAHSTPVTGLVNGQAYSFYVRCQDAAGNANPSDLAIAFSVAAPDTTAPVVSVSAPAAGATVSGTVSVSASASDNVGVAGVQFLVDGANLGAEDTVAPYTLNWSTTTAGNGVHLVSARARDAAGNQTTSATVSVTVANAAPDTTPPTVALSGPTAGATVSGTVSVSATASDNVGVVGVQFLLDGVALGAEDTTAPYAVSWSTVTASNGAHSLAARARDAAGNQTTSAVVGVTVANAAPSGLVAAYGFNEGSGSTLADQSGNGNNGTISGATWTTAGKFGNALVFNGTNAVVTVPNSASLQLTTGMTLAAWVYPTTAPTGWRSVVTKNVDRYFLMASSDQGNRPAVGGIWTAGGLNVFGTAVLAVNTWTHMAATFDGAVVRFYINGVQVASQPQTTPLASTTGTLQIGGDSYPNEFFAGRIDEVRIYNKALTAAQVASDMTTPVAPPGGPDTTPPTAPGALVASAAGSSQSNLTWGASTDNVGVTGYGVERCQGTGCTDFVQVSTVTGTSASDTGLVALTSYNYRVRATDAAGNLGAYSNTATVTTPAPDVTPPTAPSALTAAVVGTGQINLSWAASTDDVGVTGYRVERCQGAGCTAFAQVLTPTGASASDSGLASGTSYSYRVRATDGAGNLSGYSASASATTAVTNPIMLENQQAGTEAWQLGDRYGRPYATDTAGQIKGYASAVSVNKGGSIDFHVSVNPAQTFTIDVYRIGWYQGLGARLMQQIGPLNGVAQPACPTNASTGMTVCAWTPSYTLNTQASWTSGIYLSVLKNAQGFHNYMVFTLRDDSRVGALLYQQPVTTAQAYNNYPDGAGKSLYEHSSSGANTMAGTPRAVKVSFDRPYSSHGDGQFLELSEINFLRWAEKSGFDITYSTDVDTHRDGARLLTHRAMLSLPHDEYWSKPMYDAAVAARDAGVNLAFFGANSVFWQIRFEPSASGVPDRVIVCYKDSALDPVTDLNLKTVQWREDQNGPNRPEQTLVGVQFTDGPNSGTASFVVANSDSWVYAGTGFSNGTVVPGLVWYESDRQVAGTPLPVAASGTYVLLSNSPYTGSGGASDRNNASIYQAPSGAWVFATGTMGWGWGLDNFYPEGEVNTVDTRIQRATANVLNRFLGR
jgi:hypothetical protein